MIRVQREDFDPGAEIAALARGRTAIGGIVTFLGVVRTSAGGEDLTAMTLEHYPGMTERALAAIEEEALKRWPLEASLVIHRYGRLVPGERIVLVVTASQHRKAAFEACEFLVDWLKTKAPFWKLEETAQGPRWVDAQAADESAAQRWIAEPAVGAAASVARVPFMITQEQKAKLRKLGYDDASISAMTPEEAHTALNLWSPRR